MIWPDIEEYRSFHWLLLSPSQWPEYIPWLGKVEREITKGRFATIRFRALEKRRERNQRTEIVHSVKQCFPVLVFYRLSVFHWSWPGRCFSFHESIQTVHIIVYWLLLLCSGTNCFSSQQTSKYTWKVKDSVWQSYPLCICVFMLRCVICAGGVYLYLPPGV